MDSATFAGCPVDNMEKLIACLRNLNATEILLASEEMNNVIKKIKIKL